MSGGFMQKTSDSVWWENVSGPTRLVLETVAILRMGKSVCLHTQEGLPFRYTFFEQVADALRETEQSLLIEEAIINEENPADYLIDRFDLRADYRETMKPIDFLLKSKKLSDRLLPVVCEDMSARKWLEFTNSYKSGSLRNGLFLLETKGYSPVNALKNVQVLKYSDFVTEYDSLLFAGLITDIAVLNTETKKYLTAMAVSLFGVNAERVTDFVRDFQIDLNPSDFISPNGFSDETLSRRLWNAQVAELFPLIMKETREIIEKWRGQLNEAFAYIELARNYKNNIFHAGLLNAYEEPVHSPDELELATLCYLMRKKRQDRDGNLTFEYVFFIPDDKARERIKLLYEMRNKIAHGKVCPVDEVVRLLRMET